MIFVILHPYLTIKNLNIFTTSLEKNKIKIKKGKYKMGRKWRFHRIPVFSLKKILSIKLFLSILRICSPRTGKINK